MKWINKKLTQISVFILKKIRWKNTKSNQRIISGLLGTVIGWVILFLTLFK